MKKYCKLCYRTEGEVVLNEVIGYCEKCLDIIGKGPGYKSYYTDEQAEEWFKGIKQRKEKIKNEKNKNYEKI